MGIRGSWVAALLWAGLLLVACGGGGIPGPSDLLSGTASVGPPVAFAAVSLRCADGRSLATSTNDSGIWQLVVADQALPCALQLKGGSVNGIANTTVYHSIALSIGVSNITPLSDLVLAQLLGASPQAWFDKPDFALVNALSMQTALGTVSSALCLTAALRQANPLTVPFSSDADNFLDRALTAMSAALANPAVNKRYADLLDSAIAANLATVFATFGPAFSAEYLRLYPN